MATSTAAVSSENVTTVETKEKEDESETLKLRFPKNDKKVQWGEEVVDNEGMGKKSSKCCCIYKKPRMFGESSSEEDSDEENDDKCKAPKNYHKSAKNRRKESHDDCNACP